MRNFHQEIDWEKGDGLVAAVVQDAITDRVLMLGYMNAEALHKTLSEKYITFYSRSRQELWTKGDTSGNRLELRGIEIDCDGDALLVKAFATGPTCHLQKVSCFDDGVERRGLGFLGELETIIKERLQVQQSDSYTVQLANQGMARIAQKIGEEGVEVAIAAMKNDRAEIVSEVSDLVYHVLVLLGVCDLKLADVAEQLASRHTR